MSASHAVEPMHPSDDDKIAFRRLMGRFATGVSVISTRTEHGHHAMTANSLTSVSLDPMLALVCVENETRFLEAVLEAGVWGMSFLNATGRRHAEWFSTSGRPIIGEFEGVATHEGTTGVLLLDDGIGWVECRTRAVYPGGDHQIIVGEVVALEAPALADPQASEPLVFWAGGYHRLD